MAMCRCKYPKSIRKKGISIIEDKEGNRCYKISFDIGRKGSNILIISRAPKVIEDASCDSIYKRIIRFLEENKDMFKGILKITVVNLFTPYEASRTFLHEEYLVEGKDYIEGNEDKNYNDSIIAQEIHDADYIIPAWGEPLEGLDDIYTNRVEFILRTIREDIMNSSDKKSILRIGELSKKGYPKHCLAWAYKDSIENFWE